MRRFCSLQGLVSVYEMLLMLLVVNTNHHIPAFIGKSYAQYTPEGPNM